MLDQRPPNTRESDRKRCTTKARMPADAPADAGRPLRRTTADAKNPGKKAADAFPAFEKYKVIQSNPPCGCPSGCGTLYGGEGVFWSSFAFPRGSVRLTSPCHPLRSVLPSRLAPAHLCMHAGRKYRTTTLILRVRGVAPVQCLNSHCDEKIEFVVEQADRSADLGASSGSRGRPPSNMASTLRISHR